MQEITNCLAANISSSTWTNWNSQVLTLHGKSLSWRLRVLVCRRWMTALMLLGHVHHVLAADPVPQYQWPVSPPFLYHYVVCKIFFQGYCLPCCTDITRYIYTIKFLFCFNFFLFFSLILLFFLYLSLFFYFLLFL